MNFEIDYELHQGESPSEFCGVDANSPWTMESLKISLGKKEGVVKGKLGVGLKKRNTGNMKEEEMLHQISWDKNDPMTWGDK